MEVEINLSNLYDLQENEPRNFHIHKKKYHRESIFKRQILI